MLLLIKIACRRLYIIYVRGGVLTCDVLYSALLAHHSAIEWQRLQTKSLCLLCYGRHLSFQNAKRDSIAGVRLVASCLRCTQSHMH